MTTRPAIPVAVRSKFDAYPAGTRRYLLRLRTLIYRVAATEKDIGDIVETLKWGQPSYRPKRHVGTTLRIDQHLGERDVAIYFHCRSRLGDIFHERFHTQLNGLSHRHIQLCVNEPMPVGVLEECVLLAFTYHKRKRESAL